MYSVLFFFANRDLNLSDVCKAKGAGERTFLPHDDIQPAILIFRAIYDIIFYTSRGERKMKAVIRYPARFYIASFILDISGLLISAIGFSLLLGAGEIFVSVLYLLFFAISAVFLVLTLYETQCVIIDCTHVCAYNIFGLVKRLEISKIETVINTNAAAFGIKMYTKRFPCIAISHKKSLNASEIESAFNAKKRPYIIFPDSETNQQILKDFQIIK